MCDSLYVKANGEFPCWSGVGESLALQTVDEQELHTNKELSLFHSTELVAIRSAFLKGKTPHSDLCSRCSVRGNGIVDSLHPRTMRVLHIEPAYLCQLSCPQCILPKVRLQLKKPPYYMTLSYYETLLNRLRDEGVQAIRIVQFEGRGEPLLNQSIGDMVHLTRDMYPEAHIQITTHGNFPFKPWMLDLDLLTVSVDGAFPESYVKYRIGGKLTKALNLMRAIRDHKRSTQTTLRVKWKYILFEWNDSDEELREADRLADELGVELCFTRTHTPGKSRRFNSSKDLQTALINLSLRATTSQTPQLKDDRDISDLRREHAEGYLMFALKRLRHKDYEAACSAMRESLIYDPGLSTLEPGDDIEGIVKRQIDRIIEQGQPSTIYHWADICFAGMDYKNSERLYCRYLDLSPNGPNLATVQSRLIILWASKATGYALPLGLLHDWSDRSAKALLRLGLASILRSHIDWIFRRVYVKDSS